MVDTVNDVDGEVPFALAISTTRHNRNGRDSWEAHQGFQGVSSIHVISLTTSPAHAMKHTI